MESKQVLEMLEDGEKWAEIQSRVHLNDAQNIIETLLPLMDEEEYEHKIATFILKHVPHDVLFNYVKNYYINSPEDHYYDATMIMMFYMAEDITDHALQIKLLLYLRERGDRNDDADVFYTDHVLPFYVRFMESLNVQSYALKRIIYALTYDTSWNPPDIRDLAL